MEIALLKELQLFAGRESIFREWEPGMVVTEAGVYLNMPMHVYHGQPCDGPSISSSGLRTIIGKSLAHYWSGSSLNKKRVPFKDTQPMVLGRAAHHILLGEDDFNANFVIQPETLKGLPWQPNRKDCREWIAEKRLDGYTVLDKSDLEKVARMSSSLSYEPMIQGGLLNGLIEASIFWKDEETGVWLKWRPDAIPTDSGDFGDLKCVADISDDGISKGIGERGYHQQGALGAVASKMVLQGEMTNFALVYVESDEPHAARVVPVHPDDIAAGIEANKWALKAFKRALDTGYWPGPKGIAGDGGYLRRPKFQVDREARQIAMLQQELKS